MSTHTHLPTALKWTGGLLAAATGAYATYAGVTWLRYGHAAPARDDDVDLLLDRFMPAYEVVERHHIDVAAPADITYAAACEQDLMGLPISRAIFKAREIILRSEPDKTARPRGLVAFTRSIGWGVLAEIPGRQIVIGAVTQPWQANVVFRALPPADFAAFNDPGYVKIVWTLRADPVGASASIFRSETRAVATDAVARARFRRYWSFVSPGISVIRCVSLKPVKTEAERRARESQPGVAAIAATSPVQ
jgi:hypothetical protein